MTDHLVIFDTQVKAGVPTQHLLAAGKLAVEQQPEVIVFIGDHWDFPSLGTHSDRGNITYHNQSYVQDLQAGIDAMELFLKPIEEYNSRMIPNKKARYRPRLIFTLGNHEFRRNRMEEDNPKLLGAIPTPERYLWDKGFEVYPYKQAVVVDGVTYCHLCPATFSAGNVGRAHLIMQKRNASWTVGHSQLLDYYVSHHERRLQCLMNGCSYLHDEGYKNGSNDHWRGIVYKHDVKGGTYDPEFITLERLMRKYL